MNVRSLQFSEINENLFRNIYWTEDIEHTAYYLLKPPFNYSVTSHSFRTFQDQRIDTLLHQLLLFVVISTATVDLSLQMYY